MPFEFACPCGKRYRVRDELAGKQGKCAQCGRNLRIPQRVPAPQAPGQVVGADVPRAERAAPPASPPPLPRATPETDEGGEAGRSVYACWGIGGLAALVVVVLVVLLLGPTRSSPEVTGTVTQGTGDGVQRASNAEGGPAMAPKGSSPRPAATDVQLLDEDVAAQTGLSVQCVAQRPAKEWSTLVDPICPLRNSEAGDLALIVTRRLGLPTGAQPPNYILVVGHRAITPAAPGEPGPMKTDITGRGFSPNGFASTRDALTLVWDIPARGALFTLFSADHKPIRLKVGGGPPEPKIASGPLQTPIGKLVSAELTPSITYDMIVEEDRGIPGIRVRARNWPFLVLRFESDQDQAGPYDAADYTITDARGQEYEPKTVAVDNGSDSKFKNFYSFAGPSGRERSGATGLGIVRAQGGKPILISLLFESVDPSTQQVIVRYRDRQTRIGVTRVD